MGSTSCVKSWIIRLRHRTITTIGTVRRRRTITTQTTTIGTARLGHRTITTNGTVRRRRTIITQTTTIGTAPLEHHTIKAKTTMEVLVPKGQKWKMENVSLTILV